MKPVEVRSELADALKLDLVGPSERLGSPNEVLPQAPSRWYLTGFLVPLDADQSQRGDADSTEEVDAANDAGGTDDATTPEPASARQSYLPSSTGLSLLVSSETRKLQGQGPLGRLQAFASRTTDTAGQRSGNANNGTKSLPSTSRKRPRAHAKPKCEAAAALQWHCRSVPSPATGQRAACPRERGRCPSFSSTAESLRPDETRDEAFAFQTQLEITLRRRVRSSSESAQPGKRRLGRTSRRPAISRCVRVCRRAQRRHRGSSD